MTRLIKIDDTYGFQDKFLWFWIDRTAMDEYGNDLPCLLVGFTSLKEAMNEAQSDYYLHSSCFTGKDRHYKKENSIVIGIQQ